VVAAEVGFLEEGLQRRQQHVGGEQGDGQAQEPFAYVLSGRAPAEGRVPPAPASRKNSPSPQTIDPSRRVMASLC
jgi:hypothetical protein